MATNPTTTPARRSFLALFAGAAVAPVAVALPAAAATNPAEPVIAEAPELLEIGERLEASIATFTASSAKVEATWSTFVRLMPALPEELIATGIDKLSLAEPETDMNGNGIKRGDRQHSVYASRLIRGHIAVQEVNGRTKEGRRLHRLARLAKTHETAMAAAYEASGREAAKQAAHDDAEAFLKLCRALEKFEPATMAGLAIFAHALLVLDDAAWAAGWRETPSARSGLIVKGMASALLRIEAARAGGST